MTDWKNLSFYAPRRWGTSEKKPVTDERDGSQAGYHIERWDDSQDAVAQPKTLKMKVKIDDED